MKPTDGQRNQVKRLIDKWRPRLYLNEWHIDLDYSAKSAPEDPNGVGGGETLAEVHACPVYLLAKVTVFPEFWEQETWAREKALVHELSHCLTQELYNSIRSMWRDEMVTQKDARERLERLTQRITHIALYQQKEVI